VKWFNDDNGFGFIRRDDGGADVFVHFSAVQMAGKPHRRRTLLQDQRVTFEVELSEKGADISEIPYADGPATRPRSDFRAAYFATGALDALAVFCSAAFCVAAHTTAALDVSPVMTTRERRLGSLQTSSASTIAAWASSSFSRSGFTAVIIT
jgi:CspA family cold shock protein